MSLKTLIDTFKESIEQANLLMELSAEYIVICMLVSLVCAAIIYCIYRFFYRGACYSENFNVLNVVTTLVTTLIILTISSNIVLSLGMVGALSIVRFRAAIKDPLDVGFLFWAISAGLTCGAGLYIFALLGTVFIALVYLLLTLITGSYSQFLLVVSFDNAASESVEKILKNTKKQLKNRTVSGGVTELTYKIRLKSNESEITDRLGETEGVKRAMLVEFVSDN